MDIFIVEVEARLEEIQMSVIDMEGVFTSIEKARIHIAYCAIDYMSRYEDVYPNLQFAMDKKKAYIYDKDNDDLLYIFTIKKKTIDY